MAKANDYTATATAEKRLREILSTGYLANDLGEDLVDGIVTTLAGEGVTIELKPRLKAVQITIPIPQPKPEPKLGSFDPKPAPEDGYEDDDSVE